MAKRVRIHTCSIDEKTILHTYSKDGKRVESNCSCRLLVARSYAEEITDPKSKQSNWNLCRESMSTFKAVWAREWRLCRQVGTGDLVVRIFVSRYDIIAIHLPLIRRARVFTDSNALLCDLGAVLVSSGDRTLGPAEADCHACHEGAVIPSWGDQQQSAYRK